MKSEKKVSFLLDDKYRMKNENDEKLMGGRVIIIWLWITSEEYDEYFKEFLSTIEREAVEILYNKNFWKIIYELIRVMNK